MINKVDFYIQFFSREALGKSSVNAKITFVVWKAPVLGKA
jgi:hypothetical protein